MRVRLILAAAIPIMGWTAAAPVVASAQPSASTCDIARRQGRALPGCPQSQRRATAAPSRVRRDRFRPTDRPVAETSVRTPRRLVSATERARIDAVVSLRSSLAAIPQATYLSDGWRALRRFQSEPEEVLRLLEQEGNTRAMMILASRFNDKGDGTAHDAGEAFRLSRRAAELGDTYGQYNLAYIYEYGRGTQQNAAEALVWYRRAAERGNASSQAILGWRYLTGRTVARSEPMALSWFRRAAEQGGADGQYALAYVYQNGRGVPRDDAAALNFLRLAANQGHHTAETELAERFMNGSGVAQSYSEAVMWYRRAVAGGNVETWTTFGKILLEGRPGLLPNQQEALYFLRGAARTGYQPALDYLRGRNLSIRE